MQENLLDNGLNNFKQDIVDKLNDFDLEDFYSYNGDYQRALGLITKNQMMMLTCIEDEDQMTDLHYNTLLKLYKAIYGTNNKLPYENWQDKVIEDGNIVIQLYFDRDSIIYLPNEIDEEQLEMLNNFNNRIKSIVNKNPEEFEQNPIVFIVKHGYDELELKNNIDDIIELLNVKDNEDSLNGKTR